MLCRHIGIINKGELIEDTTMKNLLAQLDVETFILDLECQRLDKPLEGVKRQVFNNGSLEIEMDKSQGLNDVFHHTCRINTAHKSPLETACLFNLSYFDVNLRRAVIVLSSANL